LRYLFYELRGTRDPSRVSLATSLDSFASFIACDQGKLTTISEYKPSMFKYYSTGLDKNQVRDLNISKQDLMSLFINPRYGVQPPINKKNICMEWYIHPQFLDNWMDRWFMVFDKPPCNNRKVPLYVLRKLWVEFIFCHHVNYFNIGDF